MPKNIIENQRGAVLMLMAILIPVMLIFLGVVIDLGVIQYYRLAYTNAANTASRAGLVELSELMTEQAKNNLITDPAICPNNSIAYQCLTTENRKNLTENNDSRNQIKDKTLDILQKK